MSWDRIPEVMRIAFRESGPGGQADSPLSEFLVEGQARISVAEAALQFQKHVFAASDIFLAEYLGIDRRRPHCGRFGSMGSSTERACWSRARSSTKRMSSGASANSSPRSKAWTESTSALRRQVQGGLQRAQSRLRLLQFYPAGEPGIQQRPRIENLAPHSTQTRHLLDGLGFLLGLFQYGDLQRGQTRGSWPTSRGNHSCPHRSQR